MQGAICSFFLLLFTERPFFYAFSVNYRTSNEEKTSYTNYLQCKADAKEEEKGYVTYSHMVQFWDSS